mmetsp:Transcript_47289/g.107249  ORF Transcript_47289/g.107249 Transcript_47289/m.107249 type:complete len:225 (+) Transcript_47289:14-688(+)
MRIEPSTVLVRSHGRDGFSICRDSVSGSVLKPNCSMKALPASMLAASTPSGEERPPLGSGRNLDRMLSGLISSTTVARSSSTTAAKPSALVVKREFRTSFSVKPLAFKRSAQETVSSSLSLSSSWLFALAGVPVLTGGSAVSSWYAAVMVVKRRAASASPGRLSGCSVATSFLYFILISSFRAPGANPRTPHAALCASEAARRWTQEVRPRPRTGCKRCRTGNP